MAVRLCVWVGGVWLHHQNKYNTPNTNKAQILSSHIKHAARHQTPTSNTDIKPGHQTRIKLKHPTHKI
jgi:hypothetical protein